MEYFYAHPRVFTTLFTIIPLIIYLYYVNIKSIKSLHMLQQNRYNRGNRYIKWLFNNREEMFKNFDMVPLFFYIILEICSIFCIVDFISFVSYIIVLIYGTIIVGIYSLIRSIILNKKRKKEVFKLPLKYTARIKRLMVTNTLLTLIPCIWIISTFYLEKYNMLYQTLLLYLIIYLNPIIILIVNYINTPIEKICGLYFEIKAKKKLKEMSNMDVIGITGSYGKTSTKNTVYEILGSRYNVFKTPQNFNTPFGLMISINNYLDKFNDYFIAEMGACKKGEIKELCDLVHPKYGILTRIGVAHLETFGSEEIIQKTKFELIESLPSDGIGILNRDDLKQVDYKIKNNCKIIWIGIDEYKDADVYAKDIKLSYKGTTFKVVFKGSKEEYQFETKLLGRNNIYNILDGLALGKELGVDISKMQKAVSKIQPVEHRLSLTKYNDITIIDDAYNSNPMGCKMALEVLSMMPGKRIVVTPGMIEVGTAEDEVNEEFGREIADSCDEVILIGKEKTKAIYKGLISKKYKKEHIHILNDVMDAFPLMNELKEKETYVLLENDLPDSFNEKIRGDK